MLTKYVNREIVPQRLYINESKTMYYTVVDGVVYARTVDFGGRWHKSGLLTPARLLDMELIGLVMALEVGAA